MSRFIVLFIGLLMVIGMSFAQDSCLAFDTETISIIQDNCTLDIGIGCAAESSNIDLTDTTVESPAVIALAGNNEANLDIWLIGSTSIESMSIQAAQVRFDARNKAGYNVNLRSGPGTNYDQAGVLSFDETAIADGRNADSSWIRLTTEQDGVVWVGAGFLSVEGDIASLPIATGNEALSIQEVTFQSSPCDDMPSGLLVIYEGLTPSDVIINDLDLQFTGAVAFISLEDESLNISVMEGQVQAGRGDDAIVLETGQSILLEGDEPEIQALDLALLASLPLTDLLNIPVTCIAEIVEATTMRLSPEADAEAGLSLAEGLYGIVEFQVEFQNEDASWWKLSVDTESGWVEGEKLAFIGDCDNIETFSEADVNVPQSQSSEPVVSSTDSPETVMYSYLLARVAGDVGKMQTLSCASWDGQAAIQAQSFRAMNASLENVACSTTSTQDTTATVFCNGSILTEYNGQTRSWTLGAYRMVIEAGAWRMCGES